MLGVFRLPPEDKMVHIKILGERKWGIFKDNDIINYHMGNKSNYNHTGNKKAFSDKTIRTTGPILRNSLEDRIKKCELN